MVQEITMELTKGPVEKAQESPVEVQDWTEEEQDWTVDAQDCIVEVREYKETQRYMNINCGSTPL